MEAAISLFQAMQAAVPAGTPRVWVVTAGSQRVDGTESLRLNQAPVAGLTRTVRLEHPEWTPSLFDLDLTVRPADVRLLADDLLAGDPEPEVALRKGVRHVSRLARARRPSATSVDDAPVHLQIVELGTLENLAIVADRRRPPAAGQVEVRVRASGLNFRDVLSALGMYPGEIARLGSDCAGEVVAVGEGVSRFAVGDRVVAMTEGAFASHTTTRQEFVAHLPQGVDFEQGAAIPTAYLTADITLNHLAKMDARHSVLIHSGAGGVGMAAIALARRAGATIFATAGSPEKRDLLGRLGVAHVLDSRTPDFADEVLRITGGRGVDIVLNSLAGAMLDRSFECLADGGTFLEIGKRGLWTHERVDALGRGSRYHIVDCNDYARDTPAMVGDVFSRVLGDIATGVLPWLPCTTFPFEQAPDAFRYMAQARHMGRVVFRHPVDPAVTEQPVQAGETYVVTGGLRGLGLVAAQWLASEGARDLVLAGRREPAGDEAAAIAGLEASGVRVSTVLADVSSRDGVGRILDAAAATGLPLGGLVHAAAVLDDGVIARQTPERFAAVMGPKADGAWFLHQALVERQLTPRFFVMYSSLSSVLGSPGQSNYVAANAFLDALADVRRDAGAPATSINWGAWSEVGMAARGAGAARAGTRGLEPLSPALGSHVLGLVIRDDRTQVAVADIDWAVLRDQPGAGEMPFFRRMFAALDTSAAAAGGASSGPAIDLAGLEGPARLEALSQLVRRELATVLALGSADLPDDQPFTALGLDSLTAVELRNRLQSAIGMPVPATAAFEWPSIAAMAEGLDANLGQGEGTSGTTPEAREEFIL
ncbi:MAG: SDR family NAD(P)-dependent oxidoreductase [Vicinamibacterales bacterium]